MSETPAGRVAQWRERQEKAGYCQLNLWVKVDVPGKIDALARLRNQPKGDAVRDAVLSLLQREHSGGGDLHLEPRQEHRLMMQIQQQILERLAAAGAISAAALSTPTTAPPPLRPPLPPGMAQCKNGHEPHPKGTACPGCRNARQQRFREKQDAHEPAPASGPPPAPVAAPREDEGRILGGEDCPWYDQRKYMLGPLCKARHEWGTTGQSLRGIRPHGKHDECPQCKRDRTAAGRKQRAATRGAEEVTA